MHRNRFLLLLVVFSAAALIGCRGNSASASQRRDVTRKVVDVTWRERWMVGGGEEDTTVLMPAAVVGDGERVYVLETRLHRLTALRAADGSVVWRAGGEGSGPQELRNPTAISLDRHGNLVVMDQGNGRLAVLAPTGTFVSHVALQELGFPNAMCALADGGVLVAPLVTEHPLVRVSSKGRVVQRYELPWRDLEDAGSLSIQGDLESDGGGGCIYALSKGRGFVQFTDGRMKAHDYVEWFDVPGSERSGDAYAGGRRETLAEGPTAAQGVGVGQEEIAIGFSGLTNEAGRQIDIYDRDSGAYRHTYRAPRWFERMARAGPLYVFITRKDGYPAVLAAEPVNGRMAP